MFLDALKPQAATYYSLVDKLNKDPHYEDRFRRLYQDRFAITQDITLLAGSQRKADLSWRTKNASPSHSQR